MSAFRESDPPQTPPAGAVPQRDGPVIGSYQVVRELGRGGMGVVYIGVHRMLGQRVALKVLREDLLSIAEIRARFEEEARIGANIRHANVVQIIDLLHFPDGRPCIVMEYCEGKTLDAWAGREPMVPAIAAAMLEQVCGGLAAAHRLGIVHRDIKGDNVIVMVEEGVPLVKLADFGIAKLSQMTVGGMTAPGTVMGTPHYMSPEQARGERVDSRADVYAVGILAYRLLMGKLPFTGTDLTAVLVQHLAAPPPEMVGVPPALRDVVLRALAKKKEERYADAGELKKALTALLQNPAAFASPAAVPVPEVESGPTLDTSTLAQTPSSLRSKPSAPRPPTPVPSTPAPRDDWTAEAPTAQRPALTPPPAPRTPTPPARSPTPSPASRPSQQADRPIPPTLVTATPGRIEIVYGSADVLPRLEQAKTTGGQLYVPHPGKVALGHVAVSIQAGDQLLQLEAEVSVVFGPEEGIKFNLPPGFALAIRKNATFTRATRTTGSSNPGMPTSAAFLSRAASRIGKNHFDFLAVPVDAEWLKIASAIDFLQRKLDEVVSDAAPADLKTLEPLRKRLAEARSDLTEPAARLRYNAKQKNHLGIARAIRDNVDLALLASIHAESIKSKPKEEAEAKQRSEQAGLLAREGNFSRAMEEITAALKLSPLSFALHRRFAEIQRSVDRGPDSRPREMTPGPGQNPFSQSSSSVPPVRSNERTPGPQSAPGNAPVSTPRGQPPVNIMRAAPAGYDRAQQIAERSVPLGWRPAPEPPPTPIPGRLRAEPTSSPRPTPNKVTPIPNPSSEKPSNPAADTPSRRWWPKK